MRCDEMMSDVPIAGAGPTDGFASRHKCPGSALCRLGSLGEFGGVAGELENRADYAKLTNSTDFGDYR
jgi:hypothetical protein